MHPTTLAVAAMTAAILGCASERTVTTTNVSIGQQLVDLRDARDRGAISEKEYLKTRRKIVHEAR